MATKPMSDQLDKDALQALKIAFSYMPPAIEVNSYDHGDRVEKILGEIEIVRAVLAANGVDPDEVYDEINPGTAPNSSY